MPEIERYQVIHILHPLQEQMRFPADYLESVRESLRKQLFREVRKKMLPGCWYTLRRSERQRDSLTSWQETLQELVFELELCQGPLDAVQEAQRQARQAQLDKMDAELASCLKEPYANIIPRRDNLLWHTRAILAEAEVARLLLEKEYP